MNNNYIFAKELNSFNSYLEALSTLNKKIVLFGNGTVTTFIKKLYNLNIIAVVDSFNYDNKNTISPNLLENFEYDYILITALGRESTIKKYLVENLNINSKKILCLEIKKTTEISDEERYIRAKKHQIEMNCEFNLLPYKIKNTNKVLNLIFFMGMGDYLFVTPLLKKIKLLFPYIIINSYVSKNTDTMNSKLVYDLLKQDPHIDNVYFYNGKVGKRWEEYDFSDAIKKIKDKTSIYPVVFKHSDKNSKHRVLEIFNSFSIHCKKNNIPKIELYIKKENYLKTKEFTDKINKLGKNVIILHLEARHCRYKYDKYNHLIDGLISLKYFVILISEKTDLNIQNTKNFFHLEITEYTIYETIAFIKSIDTKKYIIAVNSIILHISSALDIKALGLFILKDSTQTRQTFYKNIHVLTIDKKCHKFLPSSYSTLIKENQVKIIDENLVYYPPKLIIENFIQQFSK